MRDVSCILEVLNPQQREAVEYNDGPLLIIAGAGSGKTRVITHKIAYLILKYQVAPRRIFAATFTNKAAEEMKKRVISLLGLPADAQLNIATFHSHCANILRREAGKIGLKSHFTICDEKDQLALIKDCMKQLKIDSTEYPAKQVQWVINQAKMRYVLPEDLDGQPLLGKFDETYSVIFQTYQNQLKQNNAVDFEDLIVYVIKIFENYPARRQYYQNLFQYILVDEYQDTNYIQHVLVRALAGQHRRIYVVGDEDQSIYSWRGAELTNVLEFQQAFPEVRIVKLEQNYRSTSHILKAASLVIENNKQRLGKRLITTREAGELLYLIVGQDEMDEADQVVNTILKLHYLEAIPYSQMAVFYRQNSLSRCFEDRLRAKKIPYQVVGNVRFYDRAEIKDLISYLEVIANPDSSLALRRIINRPKRGLGQKAIERLQQYAEKNLCSLFTSVKTAIKEKWLPTKRTDQLKQLIRLIKKWRGLARHQSVLEVLEAVIDDIDYIKFLGDADSLEVISREENIEELKNSIAQFLEEHPAASLQEYLETVSLTTHADELKEDGETVALMTIHCAKGLEFQVVFIVGLEEPIFPNYRAVEETGDMEEERRLFYVAMTRAKSHLFLSLANYRRLYGGQRYNVPSMFLKELPEHLLKPIEEKQFGRLPV